MVSTELLSGLRWALGPPRSPWPQWVLGLKSLPRWGSLRPEGVWCGTPAVHILPSSWLFLVKCVLGTFYIGDQALG